MTDRYRPEPRRRTEPCLAAPTVVIRTKADRERFRAQLLAALPGPGQEPRSTKDLGDLFRLDVYGRSGLLWASLDRMARDGLVERVVKPGHLVRYWRRTEAGERQVGDTPRHRSHTRRYRAGPTRPHRRRAPAALTRSPLTVTRDHPAGAS